MARSAMAVAATAILRILLDAGDGVSETTG
jgi:hypothetical protein